MKITLDLFEAHLKCPTKCWLRAAGESSADNAYAAWVKEQNDAYRTTETVRLMEAFANNEVGHAPAMEDIMTAKWRLASSVTARAQKNSCVWESELHAMERVPADDQGKPADFIPIRFFFTNKLGNEAKLLLGFDVFVLSEALGREISVGKIIHGDDSVTLRAKTSALTGEVRKRIKKIASLLSSPSPPELVLIRHCTECEFQNRCRQKAKETDDLSLLTGMSEKERTRHRSKGIFTVTQLSYTFRPRRTPKRAKNPAKPHHFALQALAIRENTVYIHGTPGLPDRGFYYLIGALIVTDECETFHSFWADTESDQSTIFLQFAEAISQRPDLRVFHFGDYDVAAIKRVATDLPDDAQKKLEAILQKSVNVLSIVYPHVYFPTYSNSLKEIAPRIGGNFVRQEATGLDSIVWRMQWESARDAHLKTKLLEYNESDCRALKQLTDFMSYRLSKGIGISEGGIAVNRTETMQQIRPHWQLFAPKAYALEDLQQVGKSAYFDYQREKVFIRTHPRFKSINRMAKKNKKTLPSKPNKTIFIEAKCCPDCRGRNLKRDSESGHIEVDLKFSGSFHLPVGHSVLRSF